MSTTVAPSGAEALLLPCLVGSLTVAPLFTLAVTLPGALRARRPA